MKSPSHSPGPASAKSTPSKIFSDPISRNAGVACPCRAANLERVDPPTCRLAVAELLVGAMLMYVPLALVNSIEASEDLIRS